MFLYADGYTAFSGAFGSDASSAAPSSGTSFATGPGQPSLADIAAPSFAASGSGYASASSNYASVGEVSSSGLQAGGMVQPTNAAMPSSGAQGTVAICCCLGSSCSACCRYPVVLRMLGE